MDGFRWVLRVLSAVLYISQSPLSNGPFVVSLSFRVEPVSVVQKQGAQVLLRCSARPSSVRLSWLYEGTALEAGTTGVELQAGTLTLSSLQPHHTGTYQCVAHSDTGAIASRYARVAIAEIEEFAETHRRSLAVRVGGTALIECPLPDSVPPALPRYRIQGKWLEEATDEYLILPSGNLQIVSVSLDHQGMYKCGAYNPVSREIRVVDHGTKLIVKESGGSTPVGVIYPVLPLNRTVVQSESLTLECILSGGPASAVRWTKDGKELSLGAGQMLLHSNLVLSNVRASDAGRYRCSVRTDGGSSLSANYTVTVLEPASVQRGLSDQTVTAGSSVRFTCVTRGNPAPNVTWLLNSSPIPSSPRLQITGSSLRISTVTLQDQGMYQCLLDNGIGSAQSSGRLTIQSGENSMPVILSPPMSGTYQEGEAVTLSCNASGHPLPVIRWSNAEGPIATHPARLLLPAQTRARTPEGSLPHLAMSRPGSSTLYIQAVSADHAGTYICQASNPLGTAQALAVLSVEPQTSSTSAVMETQPSIHPIQSDEGDDLFLPMDGEGLEDTMGPPTERTSNARPVPEAPIIISPPQTHHPHMYDLEWRAGRDWGSPINAYFVKYRKVDDLGNGEEDWHSVRVPGSEKSLPLSELQPSSLYEVLTGRGVWPGRASPLCCPSEPAKKSTSSTKNPQATVGSCPKVPEEKPTFNNYGVVVDKDVAPPVPEAPDRPTVSVATDSSVYVTWVPRANGGSPITAFRVEYRKRNGDWLVAADNISPLKLSVEVRNLEPGSSYRFRVVALNMYGESPASTFSRPYQVSAASPPSPTDPWLAPTSFSTDAFSDTQIMLRWTYTPTTNNNTPIQGFYIYYRPTDSDNDSDYKRDVVEGIQHWHLIGQLQAETSYDIKMQCFNDGGKSEYSNVMICETKARQPPGLPSQRTITPPGAYPPETHTSPAGLLYLIVGSVLGVMVLILIVFIAMCLWRNRQQSTMHKYDPPGYLYQPAEMNGHVLDYASLPAAARVNGGVHATYGHAGPLLPSGCHHLHHKLPNGLALMNGSGALYPSGHAAHPHDGPLPHGAVDYEHVHPHPHHLHNGGGMYTALPQSDPPDCMSCQNFCNNNRCYTKTNGTFAGGSLPVMHRLAPCQPDSLEMVPLGHVAVRCHGKDSPRLHGNQDGAATEETQGEDKPVPPPQTSPRLPGEAEPVSGRQTEEDMPREDLDVPEVCWEGLSLPGLDYKEKNSWISTGSLAGDLIQPTAQEI